MADITEKTPQREVQTENDYHDADLPYTPPAGWKYKQFRIGNYSFPWYASPPVQLVIISFVCFLCPGMFNALSGMGGGGQIAAGPADKANIALYSVFSVVGFFAGSIVNTVGIKTSLAFGGLGYSVYIASFLCYSYTQNTGFNIFAGALLGCCAGILWTAQASIMLGYPPEQSKGRYISWFWMIFNLGAVIGSLIPLGQNIHVSTNSVVSNGTYIGFIVLTVLGAGLAFSLVDAKSVIRADGSKIILIKHPTWKTEFLGLLEVLRTDWYIVLMFPMFFASNFFTTYQFNGFNLAKFDTRTRALNNCLYWIAQIAGAFIFGYSLDIQRVRRSLRARIVWVVLLAVTMAIWGGGYDFQKQYTRQTKAPKMDWTDSGYIGPMFLYIFYGMYDAAWQTCVYWYIGSLTNNSRRIACFAGLYKGVQSAGAVTAWRIDSLNASYMTEFATNWGLLAGSLIIAAPVIYFKIQDHVELEEDLKFSDETAQEVLGVQGKSVADDVSVA